MPEKLEGEDNDFAGLSVAGTEVMEIDDLLSVKDLDELNEEPGLQYEDELFEVKSRFSRDGGSISGKISRSRSRSKSKRLSRKKKAGKLSASAAHSVKEVSNKAFSEVDFFAPEKMFQAQDLLPPKSIHSDTVIKNSLPETGILHPKQRITFEELRQYISDENLTWDDLKFSKEHLNWIIEHDVITGKGKSKGNNKTRSVKGRRAK